MANKNIAAHEFVHTILPGGRHSVGMNFNWRGQANAAPGEILI
jgi:hypothetical protein